MTMSQERRKQLIARILKVNHAGEHGAIRIYGAQLFTAHMLYPEIVPRLQNMQSHEIEHHRQFAEAMSKRRARSCRLLFLWAWGGSVLGFVTAIMGRRMIWVCTEAVEDAVHHHLDDQLIFLKDNYCALHETIRAIQVEELGHLEFARQSRGAKSKFTQCAVAAIAFLTSALILMSTSGDSRRLKRDLQSA